MCALAGTHVDRLCWQCLLLATPWSSCGSVTCSMHHAAMGLASRVTSLAGCAHIDGRPRATPLHACSVVSSHIDTITHQPVRLQSVLLVSPAVHVRQLFDVLIG
ncbi:hypothetical protein COO60DRAFT_490072 [Scenedesmus sp. NREL 46B-D3]|nr:hypothetical protein COO60DRAFT_490072 [Scenedesmus sp. NREL 46B-D3]